MTLRNDDGFTLVELLVAMTLLGLLSLALVSGFRVGTRAWEKSSQTSLDGNALRVTEQTLRRAIERAYPELISIDATHVQAEFSGTESEMHFLTPEPDGNLSRVALKISGAEGDRHLTMTKIAELAAPGTKPRRTRTLITHLGSVVFAYLPAEDENDQETTWQSRWEANVHLPAAVRIRLSNGRDGTDFDIIAMPRVAADVGCMFDALTHDCAGR